MDALLANLPTLLALARTASLTAAARQLGVPRSTVSRRLARLEKDLGVVLAERNTRSFQLTDAALQLTAEAGVLVARLQTMSESLRAEAGKVRGRLRIAAPAGLGGPYFGHFLARFQRQHPDVEVEVVVTERRPHLLEEQFDVLFTTEIAPGLPWMRRRLGRGEWLAVASPAYLARSPVLAEPDDLAAHVVLSGPRNADGLTTWPRLRGAPLVVRPSLITNDLATLRIVAIEGLGIALLPLHLVTEDLAARALARVLPKHIGAAIDIFCLYAAERGRSPVLRALFDGVAKYTAEFAR